MPIKIHHVKGRSRVVIICNFCKEQIVNAKEGEYLFFSDQEYENLFFAHYGCGKQLENQMYQETGKVMGNVSLVEFIIYLKNNLKITDKDIKEREEHLKSFGGLL